MVKVSVIIPVYNVEKYLNECLDSVVNQTLDDIEIICVNNGSTDNSLAILESYANSDDRFKIITQTNKGMGSARNVGFKNSSGDYIYYVDSDDFIELNMLEELYKNAINNNSEIVVSKIARFNDFSDKIDYSIPGFDFENQFEGVDFDNFVFNYIEIKHYVLNASFAPWMKLFKRDLIEDNNLYFIESIAFEDVLFHVQSILIADKISFSPNFFYHYRNNPNSIINTSSNGCDIFKVINLVEKFLIDSKYYGDFKNEFDLFKITQILNYMLSTKSEEYFQKAKNEFQKIKLSPKNIISDYLIKRYNLVLESNSYFEYIQRHYELISIAHKNKILNLENQLNNLNTQYNMLREYETNLTNRNNELEYEIDCVSGNNVNLINKNKKLKKDNEKYQSNLKKLKNENNLLLSSNSWKLTSPLRKIMNILR